MRYAMTRHLFAEPRKNFVTHTASSKMLAEMLATKDWVEMVCEEMWPAAARVSEHGLGRRVIC